MKKVVRLTESELIRLIERVISEQENEGGGSTGLPAKPNNAQYILSDFFNGGKAPAYPINKLGEFYNKGVFPKTLIGAQAEFRDFIETLGKFKDNPQMVKGYKKQFCSLLATKDKLLLMMPSTNPRLNGVTAPVKWLCDASNEFLIVNLDDSSPNKLTGSEAKKLAGAGQIDYSVAAPYLLKSA